LTDLLGGSTVNDIFPPFASRHLQCHADFF
jgi:hypothetical protein